MPKRFGTEPSDGAETFGHDDETGVRLLGYRRRAVRGISRVGLTPFGVEAEQWVVRVGFLLLAETRA